MFEVAYVDLGLLPEQFWDLTWKEFDYLVRAKQSRDYQVWDVARTIGTWILSPHTKKKIKPKDLLKLPEVTDVKISTLDDFKRAVKNYNNGKSKTSS